MKVLIFNSLYAPHQVGGAERSVQLLAESLVSRGHQVTVASTARANDRGAINDVAVRYLRTPNLYWMNEASRRPSIAKPLWHAIDMDNRFAESSYRRLIAEVQPDLIHTNNLAGLSVAVWRAADKAGLPIVHTIRDHYLLCVRSTMFHDGQRCQRQCAGCKLSSAGKRRQAFRVTAAVGISDYILDMHLGHGFFTDAGFTRTIHNPVPTATEEAPPSNRNTEKVSLGFVGSLAPHKGIETLLRSARQLGNGRASVHVYGRPCTESYGAYLTRTYESDDVVFHGHKRPEEIYPALDVLVVPSMWNEPFGRIVPEANAFGVPVVASNRGGLPEIVRENENGFVFDIDEPDSLTRTLTRLVEDRSWKNRMPEAARRHARSFSVNAITDQYEALYREVLA